MLTQERKDAQAMTDPLYGLTRIVLHNSYFKGMLVGLNTDGHFNASGGNGAGKTSALNLIPAFYGAEPNQLVSQVSGKLSFVDYYLPHQSSALIFEHLREDGYRLAVMLRNASGSQAIYRFVVGSLDETFLHDDIRPMLTGGSRMSEIFSELQKRGIETTTQIDNITDYRAIIQNDKRLLRRNGGKKKAAAWAQQYCLGGPGSHMSHLDRMSYSVLKRDDMFNRLQQMIAETQFGDIHIDEKPAHLKDKTLIDDIASLRNFSVLEPDIRQCLDHHQQCQLLETDIEKSAGLLRAVIAIANQRLAQLRITHQSLESQLVELCEIYESDDREGRSKYNGLKASVEDLDATINRIHEEQQEWIDQDIVEKQADFNNLKQLVARDRELRKAYEELTRKIENLEVERNRAESDAKEVYRRRCGTLETERLKATEQKGKLGTAHSQKLQALNLQRDQVLAEFEQGEMVKQLDPLIERVGVLKSSASAPQITPDEAEEQDRLEDELDKATDQVAFALEKRDAAEQAENNHQSVLNDAHDSWEQAKKDVDRKIIAQDKLIKQLYPEDGSLLAELRRHQPDWAETVGKVINPELLKRKDLEPELEGEGGTLFGWSLLLSKLMPTDEAASEAILQERLARAESDVRNASEHEKQLKLNYQQLAGRSKRLKDAHTQAKYEYGRREQVARECKDKCDSHRKQMRAASQERQAKAKQEQQVVETEINKLRVTIENRKREIRSQFSEHQLETEALYQREIQALDDELERIKQQFNEAEDDYNARVNQIEQRFSEQCQKEGVDAGIIREAREKSERHCEHLNKVQDYGPLLSRYETWVSDRWNTLADRQAQLTELSLQMKQAEDYLSALKTRFTEEQKHLKVAIATESKAVRALTTELDRAQGISDRLTPGNPATLGDSVPALDTLSADLEQLLDTERQVRSKLLKQVDKIRDMLRHHSESKIHRAWVFLLEQRQARTGLDEFATEFKLQLPDDLANLLDEQLPDIRDSLVEQIRAVGDSLVRYHGSLKILNDEVGKVSRHLRDKINTNQRIDSLSNIELHITSRVVEGDYWDKLSYFTQQWGAWREQRDQSIPSDTLMETLKVANDALQRADIKTDLKSLIGLRISIVENGRMASVTNSREFDALSSNGLSYLAIIVIFIGMARYLCPNPRIALHWPVDELANLSPENIAKLFEMFDDAGLYFFSAFPSTDPNLLRFFKYRTLIHRDTGIRKVVFETSETHDTERERMKQALVS
jgi:hypothetical protein